MAADNGAALRRAQVRVTSPGMRTAKTAVTDNEGHYELTELPAGRYTLSVSKTGYLTLQYGQRRPLEPGKPLDLTEGQVLERTDVALPRGGVITGRILDEFGEPLPDATVQAMRYQYVGGQRQLTPSGRTGQTDDIGQFRIFGLPPGDYYLSASPRTPLMQVVTGATGAIFAGAVSAPLPGGAPPDPGAGLQAIRDALNGADDEQTGYAPTYYPGTAALSDAQRVTVGLGEELSSISFSMLLAKMARVSGTVVDSQGQPVARGMVTIRPSRGGPMFLRSQNGGAINGGSFTLAGLPPGDYVLQVRDGFGGRGGGPGGGETESASVPISVNGSDISGIVIALNKGATVSGRVIFSGGKPPSNASVQVSAVPTEPGPVFFGPGSGSRTDASGSFALRGLDGPNLLRVTNLPSGWTLKEVRLDGVDVTDTPHEFKGGDNITGVEIELTDKSTRINGTVTDGQSQPITDYAVVVFSDDNTRWVPQTRFIRTGRPNQQGTFQITGLPPGRYFVVALEYLEQGSEMDPNLLEQLKLKATGVSLDEGETKQLNLKLSL